MKPRIIRVHQLKVGDRFTQIPAAWYGPGVVRESYGQRTLLPDEHYFNNFPLSRNGKKRVSGIWTVKFDNSNVVNPPGVIYVNPEEKVRLLARPNKGKLKKTVYTFGNF